MKMEWGLSELEDRIRAMTVPRHGTYPRPWFTDIDPEQADILIVGASSAKTFHVADVGSHDRFLDALWNRNGQTCRAMYRAATPKTSPTRQNLDWLSSMLTARGLTSLQTNVTCASAPYDAEVPEEDRLHGTEIFKAVVAHVPWKAMIVYGKGASEKLGRAFDVAMPPVPSPDSAPVSATILGRAVFISPTLAFPSYRSSVWPYLERVVSGLANGTGVTGVLSPSIEISPLARDAARHSREHAMPMSAPNMPAAFNASAANLLVWRRMHAIEAASGLTVKVSGKQTSLVVGPKHLGTDRVFRHKFNLPKADILVREDVFPFDTSLRDAAPWTTHTNLVFQKVRTDDLELLGRILDAVAAYAAERAP